MIRTSALNTYGVIDTRITGFPIKLGVRRAFAY